MRNTESLHLAHAEALRFISRKSRSEEEIRTRLLRHHSKDLVEKILTLLKDSSIVDDTKFANQWCDSRAIHNPRAAWVVEKELIARGICETLAKEAADKMDDSESAYKAGLKEAAKYRNTGIFTFRRKLIGYLKRRGFTDSISRNTITQLWQDLGN